MALPDRSILDSQQTWSLFKGWLQGVYDYIAGIGDVPALKVLLASAQAGAQSSVSQASVSAAAADGSATTAAAVAGIAGLYPTYALANAAVGGIAADAYVAVIADEGYQGQSSYYQKTGGALVYRGPYGLSRKISLGGHPLRNYPRGSVLVHVGDSNTVARPGYRAAYEPGWLGEGGVFEGWTSYNLGANGTSAGSWVAAIATGDQAEAPADYMPGGPRGGQPWQVVNANPDVIILSLGTNDWRLEVTTANLAAKTAQFRADMATLISFFLLRTNAVVILRLPQPLVYRNPDPDGYTDCVSADDAAARSAAMRAVYLEWINASDRIMVADLHKHLFGYRIDSLAASVDPEGGGAMMSDTLHPLPLGYERQVQVIARMLNPAVPYTTKANLVPAAIYKSALWAKTVQIVGSGANYFQVLSNPQAKTGRTGLNDVVRTPLNNIPFINEAGFFGALADYQELSAIGACYMYFHGTGTTFGPLNFNFTNDFPLNLYVQFNTTSSVNFAGATGPCTIYVMSAKNIPDFRYLAEPVRIVINGPQPLTVNASGGTMANYDNGKSVNIGGVRAMRDDGGGAAVIKLYRGDTATGGQGSPSAAYPGYLLGEVQFGNGFKREPAWVPDATNFPGGVASFEGSSDLVAVCTTGNLGKYCTVLIDLE